MINDTVPFYLPYSMMDKDTMDLLQEYKGSTLFSAERHYERASKDPESEEDIDPIISAETLRFKNLVLDHSNDITMEARSLLNNWLEKADSSVPEPTTQQIIYELGVKDAYTLNDKISHAMDKNFAHDLVSDAVLNTKSCVCFYRMIITVDEIRIHKR